MPWWWKHAFGAAVVFVGTAALEEWARQEYIVMQLLAGASLAGLLLGALWRIAGDADKKMKERQAEWMKPNAPESADRDPLD